ncbi:hypothetical protein MHYP_G00160680 [Metynnis hypsauchen]
MTKFYLMKKGPTGLSPEHGMILRPESDWGLTAPFGKFYYPVLELSVTICFLSVEVILDSLQGRLSWITCLSAVDGGGAGARPLQMTSPDREGECEVQIL